MVTEKSCKEKIELKKELMYRILLHHVQSYIFQIFGMAVELSECFSEIRVFE